jgi:hypothetical protein
MSRRRRAAAKLEQLPPTPPRGEDRPVLVATWTPKQPASPEQARAAWERLVAALRRAVSER